MVEVESVDVVEPSSVEAAQAREAGYASVGELLADLRGDPAWPVYRIRLRRIDGPDPRDELARAAGLTDADVAAITARLAGMDRSSSRGPWTGAVLALIADRPGIVSAVLAEAMGWERQDFKLQTGGHDGGRSGHLCALQHGDRHRELPCGHWRKRAIAGVQHKTVGVRDSSP